MAHCPSTNTCLIRIINQRNLLKNNHVSGSEKMPVIINLVYLHNKWEYKIKYTCEKTIRLSKEKLIVQNSTKSKIYQIIRSQFTNVSFVLAVFSCHTFNLSYVSMHSRTCSGFSP